MFNVRKYICNSRLISRLNLEWMIKVMLILFFILIKMGDRVYLRDKKRNLRLLRTLMLLMIKIIILNKMEILNKIIANEISKGSNE